MDVVVEQKTQYGIIRFYPLSETAQKLADLMGRMTFDVGHLKRIKELGMNVVVKHTEVAI